MKILILPCLLFFGTVFSQSYEDLMQEASKNLKAKDYCSALSNFKNAFPKKTEIGTYEYASAASAAASCNDPKLAIEWLKKSYGLGLGKDRNEISFLETHESLKNIAGDPEFQSLLKDMKQKLAVKEEAAKKEEDLWNKSIIENQLTDKNPFQKAPAGFALYFTDVDGLKVPYLVFVPQNYQPSKPLRAIVYLHGGVNSLDEFYYKKSEVRTEPIFAAGEQYNSIIIYPFAKKDFGWMDQPKAFENIFTILKDVQKKYNIDKKRIYLGGMSNGGTATFWFASQKETPFKAFFAFAPNPVLNTGAIDFGNISTKHPLYTFNAKDDMVFKYETVQKIYDENKSKAKGWDFRTVEKGSHAFIFDPEVGKNILSDLFSNVLR
ncbi:MAG: prolyl oligopeptidase family serine peptidase [Chryseobacterium sp.]|jgi:dienelactone hydrolase|uniref:prolyl oligopeptidase family serine peptidase n=1 Tax=Chryseobacterium sp. TaxID=1871047 RepID=UPI00282AC52C|nr:prolyl oligopeptidase family serine peptidase [Chryseobacterium sp.]MDR2237099.1 prolyl oligopeptidase family serine peptidase [Chryseobacterium sp.]